MVCQSCVILSHQGHRCVTLPLAAGKYRNEIGELVTTANIQIKEIRDAATQVRLVNEKLDVSFDRGQATIKSTFRQVMYVRGVR